MTVSEVLSMPAPPDRARILHDRAVVLGRSPSRNATRATLEVLVCRVRNERYAVDLRELRSVQRPTGLTRLPSAPHQIAGILNVRGELVAVLDLGSTLGLPSTGVSPDALALLVEVTHGIVGLLVDAVLGVRLLELEQLDAPLTSGTCLRGIADGSLVLLDLEQLLSGLSWSELEEDDQRTA